MADDIAVAARLAQLAAAMFLLGAPLLFLRAFSQGRGPVFRTRAWLWSFTGLLLVGGVVSAAAQTAIMFDETAAAFRPSDVASVLWETQVGLGLAARLALTLTFGLLLALGWSERSTWKGCVVLGGAIAATFPWSGHGAATDGAPGTLHLVSDIVHTLAAALWLGALLPLLGMIRLARRATATSIDRQLAHDCLAGFSGLGTIAVGLLVVTGLVNSWFLVGPANIGRLTQTFYGQILLAKLAIFAFMLVLASANRFWLTPALSRRMNDAPDGALSALQASLVLETTAGLLVLAGVSLLGTLAPVSAL